MATTPHFDLPFRLQTGGIPSATNLVANGGFESNLDGWLEYHNPGGTLNDWSRSNAWSQFGGYSQHVKWTNPAATLIYYEIFMQYWAPHKMASVVPGQAYTASAYIKVVDPGANAGFGISLIAAWYKSDLSACTVPNETVQFPGTFQGRMVGTFIAPSDAAYCGPAILTATDVAGDVIEWYIDGVQLEKGSVVTPYIDTNGFITSRPGSGRGAAVAEQDTFEDIANCVECIVRTPYGFRNDSPEFGFPQTEFSVQPIVTEDVVEIVQAQEPRAFVLINERPDAFDTLVDTIIVDVSDIRGAPVTER